MRPGFLSGCVLVAFIVTGCATPPVAPPSTSSAAVTSPWLVDAPPGDYRKISEKIDASLAGTMKTMRVVMKAHKLQPSEEWSPTIIFCMKNSRGDSEYCLNTYATKDGTRFVAKLLEKPAENVDVVTTPLPFDLAPSDDHYLDIVFTDDRLVMIIDDRTFFDHAVNGPMDEYWFSCSSIVCSVKVTYPFSLSAR